MNNSINTFRLNESTINYISNSTKLSKKELTKLPFEVAINKMYERGAIKKINPLKAYLRKKYQEIGIKLGFLPKRKYYLNDDNLNFIDIYK